MENNLTPIEKLDAVLRFLAISIQALPSITRDNLFREIANIYPEWANENTLATQLDRILHKLCKDGFVHFDSAFYDSQNLFDNNNKLEIRSYMITFDGDFFYQQGGYKQQLINLKAQNRRLDNIEMSQRNYRVTQNVLLIIVAVGTLIAGIYYLVELYWTHHWFH